MNFAFRLNWDELPEDLREDKIWDVVNSWKENGEDSKMTEDELAEDAERFIKAHFPVYF